MYTKLIGISPTVDVDHAAAVAPGVEQVAAADADGAQRVAHDGSAVRLLQPPILGVLSCGKIAFLQINGTTRFGPNRPAADIEGNGEFDFLVIYEDFWRVTEDFWRIVEEFWRIF